MLSVHAVFRPSVKRSFLGWLSHGFFSPGNCYSYICFEHFILFSFELFADFYVMDSLYLPFYSFWASA